MRLNNKGFAVSVILYSVSALVILVLLLILAVDSFNVKNSTNMSDEIKSEIIDTTRPTIKINSDLPSSITKGDSYVILEKYTANGVSGGNASCSSDLDGNVTNTSQLTTLGNHYIKCTVTTGTGRTAMASKMVKVTYNAYTATNLITNGSFENGLTNWEYDKVEVVTDGYHGTNSLRFNYNNNELDYTAMTTQTLSVSSPSLNHKYYASVMFKSSNSFSSTDERYEWYYNDTNQALLIFARKNIKTSGWTKMSSITEITADTYLSNNWYIRNFEKGANDYSYSDALILIDLTETFGSGNEPDKEWCDRHISYFDGTKTIYK